MPTQPFCNQRKVQTKTDNNKNNGDRGMEEPCYQGDKYAYTTTLERFQAPDTGFRTVWIIDIPSYGFTTAFLVCKFSIRVQNYYAKLSRTSASKHINYDHHYKVIQPQVELLHAPPRYVTVSMRTYLP